MNLSLRQVELLQGAGKLDSGGGVSEGSTVQAYSDLLREYVAQRVESDPSVLGLLSFPELYFVSSEDHDGDGEPVYSFHEESDDMLYTIAKFFSERKFGAAIECFAGAGHAGIKLRQSPFLKKRAPVTALELNPKAITLAKLNAAVNESEIVYHQGSIVDDGFASVSQNRLEEGNTLFLGNAPFAITSPKQELEMYCDGGGDGLEKTMAFVNESLKWAKSGDVVVGVAYTRINAQEQMEFELKLKDIEGASENFKFHAEYVEGSKLWRGTNGKKEQDNPMDLEAMKFKAHENTPEWDAYVELAQQHKSEGWMQLGYVRYYLEVL